MRMRLHFRVIENIMELNSDSGLYNMIVINILNA